MSYFDTKIYNKQNLKDKDKNEFDFWYFQFDNLIENARSNYELEVADETSTIREMKKEIIDEFCETLKTDLGYAMQEVVVGVIDNYDNDVEEVENPETYLYEGEENG